MSSENRSGGRLKIAFLGMNDIGRRVWEYLKGRDEDDMAVITDKVNAEMLREFMPDLILSVGYRHILQKDILSIPKMGAINFHKSLLPLNRGANPVFWTLLDATRAGVSIHYMEEGVDTGPIIAQREVEVLNTDTASTLYAKLEAVQFELFKSVWPDIRNGNVEKRPQHGEPTLHTIKEFKELRKIYPSQKVKISDFLNYLRAMTFPGFDNAYIEVAGKKYFIEIRVHEEGKPSEKNEAGTTLLKQYGF
ncbi:MAG: formyl transferase [Deltaproteobacteria bacterium]|nr:formyl transferase [Deltaproteobacteria bacterium]